MSTNEFRIARVQRTLRWFEADIPLLNMRVKELSAERQESVRQFAAALIDETRKELTRLLLQQSQNCAPAHAAPGHPEESPCEPAD